MSKSMHVESFLWVNGEEVGEVTNDKEIRWTVDCSEQCLSFGM